MVPAFFGSPRSISSVALTGLVVLAALADCPHASAQPTTKRLLYITQSAGFAHPVLPLSETVIAQLGASSGAFTVTVSHDLGALSATTLASYDAVAFFTSGSPPFAPSQKQALLDFVNAGRGFIGIHSATDTFYDWPEYGSLIGGYFDGHPWTQSVGITVEDASHPSTAALAPGFTIDDEIYQFRAWSRSQVHVLMRLDTSTVDLGAAGVNRTDNDFALAWTRAQGQGRVFYTALGHRPEVWQDTRFQQHVLGGIMWALGPQPRRAADFNGDTFGDLLWQHDATGRVVTWSMGGPGGASQLRWDWLTAETWVDWRVVATGDFNRDGQSDLVWQHAATRHVIVWYMRGRTLVRWKWLTRAELAGWRLAAIGDFNRDGHADLVWQHDGTRQVSAWFLGGLDGDRVLGWAYLSAEGVPTWSVVGAADLNRDGTPDLVWQNDDTRQVTTWFMGGPLGSSSLGWSWVAAAGPPGWSVVGTGDFDGDRQPDIVWQHDGTRQATLWYLGGPSGTTLASWRWLDRVGHPGWRLVVR